VAQRFIEYKFGRYMKSATRFAALMAAASIFLSLGNAALAATPVYAGYPAPGGTTASGSGSVSNGGRTWSYSGFDLSAYSELYYTVGATVGSTYNINAPALTADGSIDYLSFNAGLSNLASGIAVWTGSTNVPLATGGSSVLFTEFKLSVKDANSNALALSDASALGLAGTGAALKVAGNFSATWEFLASTTGASYSAALPLYDALQYKVAGNLLQSNVGGAFYSTAPVPEPQEYALLLAGLGVIGAVRTRRKNPKA